MKRIDCLLVEKKYFPTRQKAQYAIKQKCIFIEGELIDKPSKMVEEGSKIEIKGEVLPFVSRGGLKLQKAIEVFGIDLQEKIAMDIGASTGGFTDCMLQHGGRKVYAIDVGHGQLVDSLKENKRVVNLEGTNIKEVSEEKIEKVDFISIDVSFISLTQVLEKSHQLLKENGEMVVLIKPQFEAGPEALTKNGIVKDKKIHAKVIEKIMLYASSLGFTIQSLAYSPIKGGNGNIEYLLYMQKTKNEFDLFAKRENIKQIVEMAHKELRKSV